MMRPELLSTELEQLAQALAPHEIPIIIGGGYGLLLRQRYVEDRGERTLRPALLARATSDLDVFLSVEVVTDAARMSALRDALHAQGYRPIDRARYYQFEKEVDYAGIPQTLKIDLLAPLPREQQLKSKVKIKGRRIRPHEAEEIHAHAAPEAFTVAERPLQISLGKGRTPVFVPHPYSFLLLKLYACRDQLRLQIAATDADARRDAETRARYHTFDLYRIIALMTEPEVGEAEAFRDTHSADAVVREARAAAAEAFGSDDAPGRRALRAYARQVGADLSPEEVTAFAGDLLHFFPPLSRSQS